METQQKLERQAKQLRERIDSLDRYPTAPYPEEIRRQVAMFVDRARKAESQWTWKKLSERLGINHTSISKWHDEYAGVVDKEAVDEMVPVRVGSPEGRQVDAPRDSSGISVEVGEASIEGLTLEEAVEAARRLK